MELHKEAVKKRQKGVIEMPEEEHADWFINSLNSEFDENILINLILSNSKYNLKTQTIKEAGW